MAKNITYRTQHIRAGQASNRSPGTNAKEKEISFAEAKKAGMKETSVDTKAWFQPIKKIEKKGKKK